MNITKLTLFTSTVFGLISITIGVVYTISEPRPQIRVITLGDDYHLQLDPAVVANATNWCEKQIKEGNPNRAYFELAEQDLKNGHIRWSINDPDGLHYSMALTFANAWVKHK